MTPDLIQFVSTGGVDLMALSVSLEEQLPHVQDIMEALRGLDASPKLILGGG